MLNKTVLVTGATGFIGNALVKKLGQLGFLVRASVRSASKAAQLDLPKASIYNIGELSATTDWHAALDGVDTVIHCAARAHVLKETNKNPLNEFRRINTDATAHLAQVAQEQGVKRFIFLSSIGVLGQTSGQTPFTDDSPPNPQVPYAQAKWEAEQALVNYTSSMDTMIIRPPLVYGPGVGGNFKKLMTWVDRGIPLPFGAIHNKRHLISIDNLIDFIITGMASKTPINDHFIVADKYPISTTELIRWIALNSRKKIRLLPIPHGLLNIGLNALGKQNIALQLLGNLEIDGTKAKQKLGWEAPFSMSEITL